MLESFTCQVFMDLALKHIPSSEIIPISFLVIENGKDFYGLYQLFSLDKDAARMIARDKECSNWTLRCTVARRVCYSVMDIDY